MSETKSDALQVAETLAIATHADYQIAAQYLLAIRELKEVAEEAVAGVLATARKTHSAAKSQEKAIVGPFTRAEALIKDKMSSYDGPKVAGISVRPTMGFEILEPDAVPRHLCSPDNKKIGGFLKALGASAKIDGVRTFGGRTIAVRLS